MKPDSKYCMHNYLKGGMPTPRSIVIRSGSTSDAETVISGYEKILGRQPNESYIRDAMAHYPSVIACHQEVLIGFAYCGPMAPDILELANIALHLNYRSSGLGTGLLQCLESEVSKEYKAIMLTNSDLYGDRTGKRSATNFYTKNGYQLLAGTGNTNLFWKGLK